MQQQLQAHQFTILMVLPPSINLESVPGSTRPQRVTHELGIGYARLAIQLIACWMGLQAVWLMDDNVQDCYKLQYQQMLRTGQHAPLQRVGFGEIMKTVEAQASTRHLGTLALLLADSVLTLVMLHRTCALQFQHSSWDSLNAAELQAGGMSSRAGRLGDSPRADNLQVHWQRSTCQHQQLIFVYTYCVFSLPLHVLALRQRQLALLLSSDNADHSMLCALLRI